MIATDPQPLALHAALWGDPEVLLDAIDAGTFSADMFVGYIYKATAEAVLDLVADGAVPDPVKVADRLTASGIAAPTARDAVILAGSFQAAGCTTKGLHHYLDLLAVGRERRRIEAELVRLADTLHRPGGVERVKARLAGAVAA